MSAPTPGPGREPDAGGVNAQGSTPADGEGFDPFRYGRPEPGSPAAAAYPHLFPPPAPGSPDAAYPPPAPGAGMGAGMGWTPPVETQYGHQPTYPAYRPAYGYPPPPTATGSNGKAVAGFVLGICSLVLFFTTLIDIVLIVLAFVFSLQGLAASKRGKGQRGLAIAGVVLASAAAVIVVAAIVFVAIRVGHCQQQHDQGSTAYNRCLTDL